MLFCYSALQKIINEIASWLLPLRHLKPAGGSDLGGTIKETS